MAYPANDVRPVPTVHETAPAPAPQRVATATAGDRTVTRGRTRPGATGRRRAIVIGGTTAAGAGLGAIFGGKKGALIGAAIGGGAGTLYEVKKR